MAERDVVIPGSNGAISTLVLSPASASRRTAFKRWSGCAVPGSSLRHASSSTLGTLKYTEHAACRLTA